MAEFKKIAKLNDKQRRFCQEYIIDYNGTQAAIRAGYSKNTAAMQASRLLINDKVSEYLNELKAEIKEKSILDMQELDENIRNMMIEAKAVPIFDDEGSPLADITTVNFQGLGKALELYGKRLAAYSDKLDHSNKDGTLKPVIYLPDNGRDKI